jgi:hypothetical protein
MTAPQLIESIASYALLWTRCYDALGAGGRAFKSPRPDQLKTSFTMSGFGECPHGGAVNLFRGLSNCGNRMRRSVIYYFSHS